MASSRVPPARVQRAHSPIHAGAENVIPACGPPRRSPCRMAVAMSRMPRATTGCMRLPLGSGYPASGLQDVTNVYNGKNIQASAGGKKICAVNSYTGCIAGTPPVQPATVTAYRGNSSPPGPPAVVHAHRSNSAAAQPGPPSIATKSPTPAGAVSGYRHNLTLGRLRGEPVKWRSLVRPARLERDAAPSSCPRQPRDAASSSCPRQPRDGFATGSCARQPKLANLPPQLHHAQNGDELRRSPFGAPAVRVEVSVVSEGVAALGGDISAAPVDTSAARGDALPVRRAWSADRSIGCAAQNSGSLDTGIALPRDKVPVVQVAVGCNQPSAAESVEAVAVLAELHPERGIASLGQAADMYAIQGAAEYAPEIFANLFREEALCWPSADYMEAQTEITGRMRSILVDWLIEVHLKYRFRLETLYLTVNLLDRYLTVTHMQRKRLQLVGVCALLIAAKFEEVNPPEIHDCVYITDKAYSREDVLQMEVTMLMGLSFQIVVPTATHFLDRLYRVNGCDKRHREVIRYVVTLSLVDLHMIRHLPSVVAAAATMLSNELLGRESIWPASMVHVALYSEDQLRPVAEELRELVEAAPTSALQAVKKRYSLDEFCCVAKIPFHCTGRSGA
eukprot:TRINITY_DN8639_c0_g1_i1.p1 TRINITY_DN8639_c0_g1~~TRINITY_DN8639_c0_g1_i1.p1  ORF type:complete len:620 (+),score=104.53 TRINITY_DN8639_c0_g1_i1:433-2292(+)